MRTDIKVPVNIFLLPTNGQGRHSLGMEMVQFHIVCKPMNKVLIME